MAEWPSDEFSWFLEMGSTLANLYQYRWIAVDGTGISKNRAAITEIVVADGDTLGETLARVPSPLKPWKLFYAFVRPVAESITRQSGK